MLYLSENKNTGDQPANNLYRKRAFLNYSSAFYQSLQDYIRNVALMSTGEMLKRQPREVHRRCIFIRIHSSFQPSVFIPDESFDRQAPLMPVRLQISLSSCPKRRVIARNVKWYASDR